jgi:hypothetical protein
MYGVERTKEKANFHRFPSLLEFLFHIFKRYDPLYVDVSGADTSGIPPRVHPSIMGGSAELDKGSCHKLRVHLSFYPGR